MNAAQNTKYWRRWNVVCKHNNWRWLKGRIMDNAVKAAGQHHQAVWTMAEQLANRACRAPIADDLRHACHVVAVGRDVSHADFTNPQFSRLLILWGDERDLEGLLINPEHLASIMAWDNPDRARKDSLIRSIAEAASEEYIRSITADVWGTHNWHDLEAPALLGLLRKIKGNAPAKSGDPF